MKRTGRGGQQIAEYGIMLGVVIMAVVASQRYVTQSIAGGLRGASVRMLGTNYADTAGNSSSGNSSLTQQGTSGKVKVTGASGSSGSASSGFLYAQPYGPYLGVLISYNDDVPLSSSYAQVGIQLSELRQGPYGRRVMAKNNGRRYRVVQNKFNRGRGRLEASIDSDVKQGEDQMLVALPGGKEGEEAIEKNLAIDDLVDLAANAVIASFVQSWPEPETTTPPGTTLPPDLKKKDPRDRGREAAKRLVSLLLGENFDVDKDAQGWNPHSFEKTIQGKTLEELKALKAGAETDGKELFDAYRQAQASSPEGSQDSEDVLVVGGPRQPAIDRQTLERWEKRGDMPDLPEGEFFDLDGDTLADVVQGSDGKYEPIRWLVVDGRNDRQLSDEERAKLHAPVKRAEEKLSKTEGKLNEALGGPTPPATTQWAGAMNRVGEAAGRVEEAKHQEAGDTAEYLEIRRSDQLQALPDAQVTTVPDLVDAGIHDDRLTIDELQASNQHPEDLQGTWIRLNPGSVPADATPVFDRPIEPISYRRLMSGTVPSQDIPGAVKGVVKANVGQVKTVVPGSADKPLVRPADKPPVQPLQDFSP